MKKELIMATLLTAFCTGVFAAPAPKAVPELTAEQKAQVTETVKMEQAHRKEFREKLGKMTQEQKHEVFKQLREAFMKDHKDFKGHMPKHSKKAFKKFQKGCHCCCQAPENFRHGRHGHPEKAKGERPVPPAPPQAD